jgi:hypothetical protein
MDLRALLHQSPRTCGKPTSRWTLPLAAQVCHEKGWTPRRLSGESIRRVRKRLGVGWKRAKHWLVSPDPEYARKKLRDRLIEQAAARPDWVLGFQDEPWRTRLRSRTCSPGPTSNRCGCCPTNTAVAQRRRPVTAGIVPTRRRCCSASLQGGQ